MQKLIEKFIRVIKLKCSTKNANAKNIFGPVKWMFVQKILANDLAGDSSKSTAEAGTGARWAGDDIWLMRGGGDTDSSSAGVLGGEKSDAVEPHSETGGDASGVLAALAWRRRRRRRADQPPGCHQGGSSSPPGPPAHTCPLFGWSAMQLAACRVPRKMRVYTRPVIRKQQTFMDVSSASKKLMSKLSSYWNQTKLS